MLQTFFKIIIEKTTLLAYIKWRKKKKKKNLLLFSY